MLHVACLCCGSGKINELWVAFSKAEIGKKWNVACCVSFLQKRKEKRYDMLRGACLFCKGGNGKEMKCCVLCFFFAISENGKKRKDNVAVACCVSLLRKQKAKLKMKGRGSCVVACWSRRRSDARFSSFLIASSNEGSGPV